MPLISRPSQSFKDISLSFEPHPVTNDLTVLKNEDAIRKSVKNIVETRFTERFFNPDFGTGVFDLLFASIDYGTAAIISQEIKDAVRIFEPRVNMLDVIAIPYFDQNAFEITITYEIVGQDFPTQDYTFILEATR